MDWELIFWVVLCVVLYAPILLDAIGFNWDALKKDDPYKYCPKEE